MNVEIMLLGTEERVVCSSLDVAETFEKAHYDVLRDIRNLDCSEEFGKFNFEATSYTDKQGKEKPMMLMTRDGFTFLVMGYRGKKAAKFKEGYIKLFNAMEQALRKKAIEEQSRRQIARSDYTQIRRRFTDAIKEKLENKWEYKNLTDLGCKSELGKNSAQLRKERGAKKNAKAVDYMTTDEIERVTEKQALIMLLKKQGLNYQQIKAIVMPKQIQ